MKLGLGTAHFGSNYGIYNCVSPLNIEVIKSILDTANRYGVNLIDTAQAYKNSELILGNVGVSGFSIVTKLQHICSSGDIKEKVKHSLTSLNTKNLYGVLYHDFSEYLSNPTSINELQELKNLGLVKKIGFSLYYTEDLQFLLDKGVSFDLIQLPFSVFDQRFRQYFPILKERNIEIHVRSVFLQGLVFIDKNKLPIHFHKNKQQFYLLNQISTKRCVPISALCLGFAYNQNEVEKVIIGVKSQQELLNNIEHIKSYTEVFKNLNFEELAINDENIILPINWPSSG